MEAVRAAVTATPELGGPTRGVATRGGVSPVREWLRSLATFSADLVLLLLVVLCFPIALILLGLPIAVLVWGLVEGLQRLF